MSTEAIKNDIPAASAAGLIANLAKAGSAPEIVMIPTKGLGGGLPEQIPVLWDRNAQRIVPLGSEIESHRLAPRRIKGTAKVETLESFIELVNRHKNDDSAIFAATAWPSPSLTAVIDYYTLDHGTAWGQHRVHYAFPLTEEFKVWVGKNGKAMPQIEFAAFLEDHAAELAAPMDGERTEFEGLFKERFAAPNELIDLSRSLEVFVGAKVKQGIRPASGERQVLFETEHMNGKGEPVDIPGIFMLSVQPFVDGDLVRIPARIRYRIAGGEISWFYQLYRWEYWLRTRVQNDLLRAAECTILPTFEGSPETGSGA